MKAAARRSEVVQLDSWASWTCDESSTKRMMQSLDNSRKDNQENKENQKISQQAILSDHGKRLSVVAAMHSRPMRMQMMSMRRRSHVSPSGHAQPTSGLRAAPLCLQIGKTLSASSRAATTWW